MKTKYICIAIVVFFNSLVQAQLLPPVEKDTIRTSVRNDTIKRALTSSSVAEMPQIIPASPKATAMTRYGEYPVSLYTGLVDITVPVYTIKVQNITVPIEFKYHASGIKYDDISLEAGLGWSLIAGGIIDYNVRGSLDNIGSNYGFIKNTNQIDAVGNCYNEDLTGLAGIVNGNKIGSWESNNT